MHSSSKIKALARSSPLSRAQVKEIEFLIGHEFETTFLKTTGDIDLKTSLRALDKTDFFTKELDDLLLKAEASIAIHSAKDLPDPIPKGLKVIAITRGQDPRDSLVLREDESLRTLKKGAIIATSSQKREEAIRALRDDLTFCDVRGTIEDRLKGLFDKKYDGVVIAECALLRLNLRSLNRVKLYQKTAPLQRLCLSI